MDVHWGVSHTARYKIIQDHEVANEEIQQSLFDQRDLSKMDQEVYVGPRSQKLYDVVTYQNTLPALNLHFNKVSYIIIQDHQVECG